MLSIFCYSTLKVMMQRKLQLHSTANHRTNSSAGILPEVVAVNGSVGCRFKSSHRHNFFFQLSTFLVHTFSNLTFFAHRVHSMVMLHSMWTVGNLKYTVTHLIGIDKAWAGQLGVCPFVCVLVLCVLLDCHLFNSFWTLA